MKLKTYLLGISLFSALVATTSCSKVLDVEPQYTKDGSSLFTNITDYQYSLTGTYSLLRQVGYYGNGSATTGAWSTLPDMMGEELLQTTEDLANNATLTNYEFSTLEDDLEVMWLAAYRVVNQANITLRNIDQFQASQPKTVNRIKGQALAIRAMAHFDILRYWGSDYDRKSTGLGIPYTSTVNLENKPGRLTVKETYDKIFADLNAAETLLGDVDVAINTATDRSFIDLTVVRAMLARINLYAKNYAEAERYASLVITARPLASKTDFPNIWKDASVSEVIWSVSFNAGEGSPANNLISSSTNRNQYKPTASIISLYDKTADIRYSSYIGSRASGRSSVLTTDPTSAIARKVVSKYTGKGVFTDNIVNWKAFRTGEMYLIRAEAEAMQAGKGALALADLNALRKERINGPSVLDLSGTALLNAIFTERRRELFSEGHRWFDLKRTTRTVVRTDFSGAAASVSTDPLPASSRVWVFPIPQAEIDANPALRSQQAPGWN